MMVLQGSQKDLCQGERVAEILAVIGVEIPVKVGSRVQKFGCHALEIHLNPRSDQLCHQNMNSIHGPLEHPLFVGRR